MSNRRCTDPTAAAVCCAGRCWDTETRRSPPGAPAGNTPDWDQQTHGHPDRDRQREDVLRAVQLLIWRTFWVLFLHTEENKRFQLQFRCPLWPDKWPNASGDDVWTCVLLLFLANEQWEFHTFKPSSIKFITQSFIPNSLSIDTLRLWVLTSWSSYSWTLNSEVQLNSAWI